MSPDQKDIFWKEAELLAEAKSLLSQLSDSAASKKPDMLSLPLLTKAAETNLQAYQTQRSGRKTLERHYGPAFRYVSPPLRKKIVAGQERVELNKTRRVKLSIFYSISSISRRTAQYGGEALSTILNSYLCAMTEIVNHYKGTLDKYIGDAILVFFGDRFYRRCRSCHPLRANGSCHA
jgi:hypothetical protein